MLQPRSILGGKYSTFQLHMHSVLVYSRYMYDLLLDIIR